MALLGDGADAFDAHFAQPDVSYLEDAVEAVKAEKWQTDVKTLEGLGKVTTSIPATNKDRSLKRKRDDETYRSVRDISSIKKRVVEPAVKTLPKLSTSAAALARPIFEYQDVFYSARTPENADELRKMTVLHALNHVYTTRDRVLRNNERLRTADQTGGPPSDIQDQGFTRPKVLIMLETRSAAAKYASAIIDIADPSQQENKKRFENEFGAPEGKLPLDENMPRDFKELFEGNDDNHFIATLKFTRKTAKFYSGFYDSDIIIASALGLRRAIAKDPKKTDADFLSSIEVLVLDQADAMLMQNFEHTRFVLSQLNKRPRDATRTDFARVRPAYLEGLQGYLRQTLLYSAFATPELNALFTAHMQNAAGRLKIAPSSYEGSMLAASALPEPVRQTFTRIPASAPQHDPDARFEHFTTVTIPALARLPAPVPDSDTGKPSGLGILLFVPSYFDFVRVRAHLEANPDLLPCAFAALDEYADVNAARRARSLFVAGRVGALLYSGRAHHFRRYNVAGVRRAVLYGVPPNPGFYADVLGMIGRTLDAGKARADECAVQVLFSRWEVLALERVVGSRRVRKMVRESGAAGDVFEFR